MTLGKFPAFASTSCWGVIAPPMRRRKSSFSQDFLSRCFHLCRGGSPAIKQPVADAQACAGICHENLANCGIPLLGSDEPLIRWKLRARCWKKIPDSKPMRALQLEIRRSRRVQRLLARHDPAGWLVSRHSVYAKWQGVDIGCWRRLLTLAILPGIWPSRRCATRFWNIGWTIIIIRNL